MTSVVVDDNLTICVVEFIESVSEILGQPTLVVLTCVVVTEVDREESSELLPKI